VIGYSNERDHLKEHTEKDSNQLQQKVIELKEQGLSFRQVAAELRISRLQPRDCLKKIDCPRASQLSQHLQLWDTWDTLDSWDSIFIFTINPMHQ